MQLTFGLFGQQEKYEETPNNQEKVKTGRILL